MHEKTDEQSKFTGKHMLCAMVAFFAVIISVNVTMAMLASDSWTGLVVKNSYVASQAYNDKLVHARAQKAAGYRSDLTYQNGTLTLVLKDKDGARTPIAGPRVKIGRPAFEQQDRDLEFKEAENLSYVLTEHLAPGIWSLQLTGKSGETAYRRDVRLHVDGNGGGRFE